LLLGSAFTASAGSPPPPTAPPPPPWKPTNVKKVLFVLDPDMKSHLGCKATDACTTQAREFVNRHVDYMHTVLEEVSANLALSPHVQFHPTFTPALRFDETLAPLAKGYSFAFLITARKSWDQYKDLYGRSQHWGKYGWFSAQGNSRQTFAHEFGRMQGAGYSRETLTFPRWAVGYKKTSTQGTLMRIDVASRYDFYSDHEIPGWGNAEHSVGRLIRESNGRYTRHRGVLAPPLY
jgi:hypothetical protein